MKYDISTDYKVKDGIYDELFEKESTPRKLTEKLLKKLKEMGEAEAERRQKRLNYTQYYQTLIQDNDTESKGLDSVPLFISPEEWEILEKGLAQRAKLYNLIAKDIYGEQKLIKDGIVPPALVFANPDFLQMIWTGKPIESDFIDLMSTDIVRDKDGSFVAVNDRFQIPEGIGSTLENRLSMARAYPELFHDLNVKRMDKFFDKFRQTILAGNEDGGAVLLASEPERFQRTEDSILARHLKIQLVENDDLSVRGFKVYLKEQGYSAAVVSDTCSRVKRADKIKEWYYDDLYLYYLEREDGFKSLSVSVKSQIRKAVKLYNEYNSLTLKNETQ